VVIVVGSTARMAGLGSGSNKGPVPQECRQRLASALPPPPHCCASLTGCQPPQRLPGALKNRCRMNDVGRSNRYLGMETMTGTEHVLQLTAKLR
jgi:hypothetical protein